MNKTILIKNGRVVTGTGKVFENGAVLIEGTKIKNVYSKMQNRAFKKKPKREWELPLLISAILHL